MRRILSVVLIACTVSVVTPSTATAQQPSPSDPQSAPETMVVPSGSDLPVGFTDGIPVGGEGGPEEDDSFVLDDTSGAEAKADTRTGARAVTQRYFGAGPWQAITTAAANAPRACFVSNDGLVSLMVAPVFKESSAATTASSAPSPMTLSRADEWTTGVYNTNTNLNANYGLYEANNPNTPYQQAYWHPGIGIWQYDSAGVGAPFTAIERMDVNIVGADVARGMANRYCASSSTDGFAKRRAAWQPWGTACTTTNASANLCEIEFQALMAGTHFTNISLVAGISASGGAVARTCRVEQVNTPCWYVNPALSQGATTWKFNPSGGPDWRTRPTPLSKPFYVVKRNGYEERHWLKADSGYSVDISAKRRIGKNARPRTGTVNAGSGLSWSRTSTLCDITAARGGCSGASPITEGERACFVKRTVEVFLNRTPTSSELQYWVAWTKTNQPSGMANELANSEAWLGATVDGIYQAALGRASDPAGRDFWVGRLRAGAKVNDIGASIYGSTEFYRNAGGTADGFVRALYLRIVGRTADAGGLAYWKPKAVLNRGAVAAEFFASAESRTKRVRTLYVRILGRAPDPVGQAHWVNELRTVNDVRLAVLLASSVEFYDIAKACPV